MESKEKNVKVKEEEIAEFKNTVNPLLIPISIIVAGVIIAGAMIYNNISNQKVATNVTTTTTTATATPTPYPTVTVSLSDVANTQGNSNSKVAIVEYSDYQCPYCALLYANNYSSLKTDYINTNKLLLAYKDFPLTDLHPYAMIGAISARCAGDQGKYWQMHEAIFDSVWNSIKDGGQEITNDQDKLAGYAKDIGLDTTKYSACVSSNPHKDEITADINDGNKIKVSGTPTLVIGKYDKASNSVTGEEISGIYDYTSLKQIISQYQ